MQVIPAVPEDMPRLCELLALLFAQEKEFSPDIRRQSDGLNAIIANPAIGQILVLKDGSEVVGMVNLLFTVSTFLGSRVSLLEDLIVHPAHRGKGGGTLLLEAARRSAAERGCRRITLLTDAGNAKARAFYEAQGFTVSTMLPYRMMLD